MIKSQGLITMLFTHVQPWGEPLPLGPLILEILNLLSLLHQHLRIRRGVHLVAAEENSSYIP